MATQPQGSNLCAVISVQRGNKTGRFAHTIYQEDLQQQQRLEKEKREAIKEADEWNKYLEDALRSGARVEPGLLGLEIVNIDHKARHTKFYSSTKVVVR